MVFSLSIRSTSGDESCYETAAVSSDQSWECCWKLSHGSATLSVVQAWPISGHVVLRFEVEGSSAGTSGERLAWLSLSASAASKLALTHGLANGYQCWSESPLIGPADILNCEEVDAQRYFGDDRIWPFSPSPGNFHSWSYTYLGHRGLEGVSFFGACSEDLAHTVFQVDLESGTVGVWLDLEGKDTVADLDRPYYFIVPSWWCGISPESSSLTPAKIQSSLQPPTLPVPLSDVTGVWRDLIAKYRVVGTFNSPSPAAVVRRGYCSWYRHYTSVSEDLLLSDLTGWASWLGHTGKLDEFIFQLDDGYQPVPGDWHIPGEGFSEHSLAVIAREVRTRRMLPGIWLAPFIASHNSEVFQTRQDWLLVGADGELVQCGDHPLWGGPFYALNSEHPGVRTFVQNTLERFAELGFGLVKLDFLYATSQVALDSSLTRAERAARAHQFLYDCCQRSGLLSLSCGATLSSAAGRCDYSRIGPDVGEYWDGPEYSREGVSTRASIVNAMTRSHLDGVFFLNDTDVSILRSASHNLTLEQQRLLCEANLRFSSLLFCSDNPAQEKCAENRRLFEKWLKGEWGHTPRRIAEVAIDKRTGDLYLRLDGVPPRNPVMVLPKEVWQRGSPAPVRTAV